MGKEGNCVVVKPCEKEHALSCVRRVRRIAHPRSSQDLLHGNASVCVGFQNKHGNHNKIAGWFCQF